MSAAGARELRDRIEALLASGDIRSNEDANPHAYSYEKYILKRVYLDAYNADLAKKQIDNNLRKNSDVLDSIYTAYNKKFDLNRLVNLTFDFFHKEFSTKVPNERSGFYWVDQQKGIVAVYKEGREDNFKALRNKLVGPILQKIRNQAFNSNNPDMLAMAYVISGIDILGIKSGDIKTPLSGAKGASFFDKTGKLTKQGESILTKQSVSNQSFAGIQIGHTSGPGVIRARRGAKLINDIGSFRGLSEGRLNLLTKKIIAKISTDGSLEINDVLYGQSIGTIKNAGYAEKYITITIAEFAGGNKVGGRNVQKAIKRVIKRLESYREYLANLPGSPSYLDNIKYVIENQFLEKPIKSRNSRKKLKLKAETSLPITVHSISRNKSAKLELGESSGNVGIDVQALISLINKRLHDTIKRNMGQGNAPKRLNYRTGRFAQSAELKGLNSSGTGKTLLANITYQRNPYDVFLPGGRLHNELRDPEKLIGKSIRQILKEEGMAALPIRTQLVR